MTMKRLLTIAALTLATAVHGQIQQSGYVATPSATTSILGQATIAMTNNPCNVVTPGSNCTVSGLSTSYLASYAQTYYLTGSLSSPETLTIPLQPGAVHVIFNSTGQTITVGGSSGATVAVATGTSPVSIDSPDGTNYYESATGTGPCLGCVVTNPPAAQTITQPVNTSLTLTTSGTGTTAVNSLNTVINVTGTLNAAVTTCGSNPTTLQITTGVTLSASVAVPINCTLLFQSGGELLPTTGQVVTFVSGGQIQAPPTQKIFGGLGTVVGFSELVPLPWYGAVGYTTLAAAVVGTDSTAFIQAAINGVANQGTVLMPCLYYRITSALTITTPSTSIIGSCPAISTTGLTSTSVVTTSSSADIIDVTGTLSVPLVGVNLENFTVQRSVGPTGSAVGINLLHTYGMTVDKITVEDSICDWQLNDVAGLGIGAISNSKGVFGFGGFSYTANTTAWCDQGGTPSLYMNYDSDANNPATHTGTATGIAMVGSNIRDITWTAYNSSTMTAPLVINCVGGTNNCDDIKFNDYVPDEFSGTGILIENMPCPAGTGSNVIFMGGHFDPPGGNESVHIESSCGIQFDHITNGDAGKAMVIDNSLGGYSGNIEVGGGFITSISQTCQILISGAKNINIHDVMFTQGGSTAGICATNLLYSNIHDNHFENSALGVSLDPTSGGNSITGNTCDPATVTGCLSDASTTDTWSDPFTGNAQYPGTVTTGTGVVPLPSAIWKVCGDTSSSASCTASSSTSVRDSTGNGNTGTWSGTQSGTTNWYSVGVSEPFAGHFNGTDNYITTGLTPSGLTAYTIVAREFTTAIPSVAIILANVAGSPLNGIDLFETNIGGHARVYSQMYNAGSESDTNSPNDLPLSQWNCIAVTHAAGATTLNMYVNGTLSNHQNGTAATNPGNSTAILIGAEPTPNDFFNGLIGDVRVYPGVVPNGTIPGCI